MNAKIMYVTENGGDCQKSRSVAKITEITVPVINYILCEQNSATFISAIYLVSFTITTRYDQRTHLK